MLLFDAKTLVGDSIIDRLFSRRIYRKGGNKEV